MDKSYWQKQTEDKPLYPDLLWSRPENRTHAGKLLIIGGNIQSFAAVAKAYAVANEAGIGTARVLLPDALQKTVSKMLVGGEYASSTPSGSFARQALALTLDSAAWADAVLLAGDFGRNSETAIMLEQLTEKYSGKLIVTKDAIDYYTKQADSILNRKDTLLVLTMANLQRLGVQAHFTKAFTFNTDLLRLVDNIHDFTNTYEVALMLKYLDNILCAYKGNVVSTKLKKDKSIWRVDAATKAGVWWLQNPSKTLEALATSLQA